MLAGSCLIGFISGWMFWSYTSWWELAEARSPTEMVELPRAYQFAASTSVGLLATGVSLLASVALGWLIRQARRHG